MSHPIPYLYDYQMLHQDIKIRQLKIRGVIDKFLSQLKHCERNHISTIHMLVSPHCIHYVLIQSIRIRI